LSEVCEANVGEVATKKDLQHLEERFNANLQRLEERFDAKLERFDVKLVNLKFELLKWLIRLIVAQTCLLIAPLNFFRSVRELYWRSFSEPLLKQTSSRHSSVASELTICRKLLTCGHVR